MTPERWREIERLYHSACEGGIAVLSGIDPELRREVEKLLAQDPSGKILDRPAGDLLAEMTLTEPVPEVAPDLAGHTISHYDILERLGAGGMGVVYKAFDTKLNRLVALKFLPHQLRHDPDLKRRLTEEARAASALDHPNIVVIYEIGEADGELFISMAFHEGATLRARIDGPLPVEEALRIARQVASGLAKAHQHGIVHRDIKPSNIVVAEDGIVRIIDFGLAKSIDTAATLEGGTRGTPLYMSPEQASGKPVDFRTDIWSLGVVLYEMLAGAPPFRGGTVLELMRAVVQDRSAPLREVRPGLPAEVESIVSRALQKDPAKRYQSAAEMGIDVSAVLAALEGSPAARTRWRPLYMIPVAVLLVAVAGSTWLYQRSQKRLWAREQAIPEIIRLKDQQKPLAAYLLLHEVEKALPAADSQLAQLREAVTHEASVRSSPSGASVAIKDYLSPGDAWFPLGTTPLDKTRIPSGYLRWQVSKAGLPVYEGAPVMNGMHGYFRQLEFLLEGGAKAPEGMVFVPAAKYQDYIWSLGDFGPYDLPAYYIDRFEVTNRQYQDFVDRGGYQKHEYWKHKFMRDGRELSWERAMDLLRDSTGRPGPSTWKAGHYPEGQADYPVGGVSWYEAAAYAEFAGKSLPVIAQWFRAAPSSVARHVIAMSNFSLSPAPVGKYQGLGPWGTYDMAGNVAEWCWNESGGGARYLLGGAFDTATAEYFEPGGVPPFHRGPNAGFRCVRNTAALPKEVLAERRQTIQDFSKAKPASDDVFRIYKTLYLYDRTPLNAKIEAVTQDSAGWRKEKVVIDAAYGKERMAVYLFLPARVRPPYETVVFYPTARAIDIPSSDSLADMHYIDFVIQSGRAVVYPIYKGTYERSAPPPAPDTVAGRESLIQASKDLGRSIDYLETRADIDSKRIAFMGVSMGAALGVVLTGVEERLKAVIFLDGGFYYEKQLPGANQADFAPRIKAPTLLISGKFDWIFLGKDALLRLIGTPSANKKAVTFDTAHDVSEQRTDLVREVLAWLDQYLGKIR
jgi:serine/threonine protein kinase/dienelactone hydrolase